ncbi:hypothetical protein BDR07DRAFT_1211401, partial [Suillus spraguei]
NRLTAQLTHAIWCVGLWSIIGLVKDKDILAAVSLPDSVDSEADEYNDGWDSI